MKNFLILLVAIVVLIISFFNFNYLGVLGILEFLNYKIDYEAKQIMALIGFIIILIMALCVLIFFFFKKLRKILNIFENNQKNFESLIKEVKSLSTSNAELKDTVSQLDPDKKIDTLNNNIQDLIKELKITYTALSNSNKSDDSFPNRERERRMIDDIILYLEYREKERLLQKKKELNYSKEDGRSM